ncbi:MAG: hypothetical protein JWO36_2723 [Myxococcales bacterium]|nr:hypothetical protein [Myxococcales bacterium]
MRRSRLAAAFVILGACVSQQPSPRLAAPSQPSSWPRPSQPARAPIDKTAQLYLAPHQASSLRISGSEDIVPDLSPNLPFNLFPTYDHVVAAWLERVALSERVTGLFDYCVDEFGHVTRVEVMYGTGDPYYDAKIVRTMRHWLYRPRVVAGEAVRFCSSAMISHGGKQPAILPAAHARS